MHKMLYIIILYLTLTSLPIQNWYYFAFRRSFTLSIVYFEETFNSRYIHTGTFANFSHGSLVGQTHGSSLCTLRPRGFNSRRRHFACESEINLHSSNLNLPVHLIPILDNYLFNRQISKIYTYRQISRIYTCKTGTYIVGGYALKTTCNY